MQHNINTKLNKNMLIKCQNCLQMLMFTNVKINSNSSIQNFGVNLLKEVSYAHRAAFI